MSDIFPQQNDLGGLWTGLDDTPTGSDASAIMVADFTGSAQTLFVAPSLAVPVTAVHSETLGSTFKLNLEGMWVAAAMVQCQTAASVGAAIGFDNVAGELNTATALRSARVKARMLRTAAAADTDPVMLVTPPFVCTRNQAQNPALGIVRVLLNNNAGAGAAAAALVLPACDLILLRIGELPSNLRDR